MSLLVAQAGSCDQTSQLQPFMILLLVEYAGSHVSRVTGKDRGERSCHGGYVILKVLPEVVALEAVGLSVLGCIGYLGVVPRAHCWIGQGSCC